MASNLPGDSSASEAPKYLDDEEEEVDHKRRFVNGVKIDGVEVFLNPGQQPSATRIHLMTPAINGVGGDITLRLSQLQSVLQQLFEAGLLKVLTPDEKLEEINNHCKPWGRLYRPQKPSGDIVCILGLVEDPRTVFEPVSLEAIEDVTQRIKQFFPGERIEITRV